MGTRMHEIKKEVLSRYENAMLTYEDFKTNVYMGSIQEGTKLFCIEQCMGSMPCSISKKKILKLFYGKLPGTNEPTLKFICETEHLFLSDNFFAEDLFNSSKCVFLDKKTAEKALKTLQNCYENDPELQSELEFEKHLIREWDEIDRFFDSY